ncbi:hypothetical protein BJ742DRAFT_394949 [Cladochytrium replicatum]|nr:hypothetical protein BJ742DRAFT_394949 [Cladochytrium replicatum]
MPRPLELRLSFSNPNAPLVSAAAPVNSSDKPAGGSEGRKQSDGKVAAAAAAVAAVAAAAAAAKEAKEAKDAKKAPAGTKEKEKEKEKKFEDKDAVDLRTIHLANLPQNIDKSDVEKVFGIHGDIRRIQIVQKPKDKRVYAFVSFRDEVSCRKALASIKDALYFDMTEALKAEYAKQQNPDKKRKAIDKPWKKGEALEKRDRNDRKREGGQDKATDKRAEKQGGGEQRRKSSTTLQRTVIFISSVPTEFASIEALQGKLGEFGNILSIYVVSRHDPASTAQFALVTFEKAEDASKVIAAKVLTCVFPRQRRVVVRGIPESATEEEVKAFFVVLGDIRRVEKFEKDGGDNGWMIEFVRPESAARTLVKAVEDKFGEAVIKAEYAPSTNKTNAAANAAATDAAASDEKGAEDDEDDEAAEADEEAPVEQLDDDESSSEDEEAAIVVEEEEVVVEAKEHFW